MGKKRHTQDKMWITYTELVNEWGGKKEEHKNKKDEFVKMPYYYCNLTMAPFQDPYCTDDGIIFDLLAIVPYLKKYKKNPVTGAPMTQNDLIKLNFHKNEQGQYHCPITFKVFTDHTHIVAIRETGNVYSYEAYKQFNKDSQFYHDLLTNDKFDPKKIITIQDPQSPGRKIGQYHFMQNNEDINSLMKGDKGQKDKNEYINQTLTGKKIMDDLKKKETDEIIKVKKEEEKRKSEMKKSNHFDYLKNLKNEPELSKLRIEPKLYIERRIKDGSRVHSSMTEGLTSGGFTSTRLDPTTENKMRQLSDDEIRKDYQQIVKSKQKTGQVQIITNYGIMIAEIYSNKVPKTGENFIELCEQKYYKGVKFHRLIKNFMVQGGDPTGTGRGGTSYFGKQFNDEFDPSIPHLGRGILSMANSGTNTNGSQFFITFKSCPHLDGKHSVFGKIIKGLEILDKIESITVDKEDKPQTDIVIEDTIVIVNPYRDAIAEILLKEWKQLSQKERLEKDKDVKWTSLGIKKTENQIASGVDQIGKYLDKKK